MWSVEHSGTTTASPEAVWALLSDVDGWGAWNDGIDAIALADPSVPLAVGASFTMTPSGQDAVRSVIAELSAPRLLTDVTDLGDVVVRVEHRLEALGDGGTRITYALSLTGPAADAVGPDLGAGISSDFPEVIAALGALAASGV